ncbi:J domain-containing protein [Halorubrum vacuolatum]|uniref:DnaJ domain-containing protein n=1 Tax=Halorubrum vacuolatum TaxID=63740 RepID=A0A238VT82_HALVU|nr:J domain-containing protein [Halorubrum vacuolatum]SNR37448.1 DnaJ domain-containing protein [Halorubrum vacuolatum]
MSNRTILVGMAAAFVGLTSLLVVAGIVVNPLLLAIAVPFGAVTYFLWYHASGRLHAKARREAATAGPTERERARQRARAASNRREAYRTAGTTAGSGAGRTETGRTAGASAGGGWNGSTGDPRERAPRVNTMTEREAYAALGLEPSADGDAVRSAYRQRVKRVHPDREDGDEEAFKRVTEAYELLRR